MNSIKSLIVDFRSNSHTTPGFLARPDDVDAKSPVTHPAIVVIQEYWGLVPHIKDIAERFAREGFVALAPDLFHGKQAAEPDEALKLAMALDRERAVAEIAAAVAYLQKLRGVASDKIGVVGFCMGGGLALSAAAHDGQIKTVVAFYGRPLDASDTAKLHMPVLGLYAEKDHQTTAEMLKAFEKELEKAQVPHEIHVYPGTQHAFFNDTRPGIYDPAAAQDAWRRTLEWLRKYLT